MLEETTAGLRPFARLVLPQYPEYIQVTEGRRPVYYLTEEFPNGIPLPKRFLKEHYIWKKGRLFDTDTKEFVLRNQATRHKPRMMKINGQSIWNGTVSKWSRNKL